MSIASVCGARADTNVIISEILAKNDTGIQAEDGQRYDWIELFNMGEQPVNLTGWHLTDDINNLSRWTFPGAAIGPKEFLLLFASGLDRTNDPAYLHTNFKLSSDGEYVGLIAVDGTNVIDEIAPAFPPLGSDESYGVPMERSDTILLGQDAPVRVHVPQDASLGDTWKAESFDDSGWTSGLAGVGYDLGGDYLPYIKTDVISMYTNMESCYIRQSFPVTNLSDLLSIQLNMKYDDGFVAYINGQKVEGANDPASPAWNSGASLPHNDPEAIVYAPFPITISPHQLLHDGTNTLCVQGLNYLTTSSDFLIVPQIVLQQAQIHSLEKAVLDEPTPGTVNSKSVIIPEPGAIPSVYINEIMAQNGGSVFDPELNYERDWFELFSAETTNIDLSGYYLTDDPASQRKWSIPDGTIIPAGGFLLFWADGEDIAPDHCNFSLSVSGETLVLSTPATQVVDMVAYGAIPRDISKGRYPDGSANWYYYDISTPRQSNGAPGDSQVGSQLPGPVFLVAGGSYSNDFLLTISPPGSGVVVRYTLDGSVPRSTSPEFSAPIPVATAPGRLLFSDNFGRDFDFNGVYNTTVKRYGRFDEGDRFRGAQRMTDYTTTTSSGGQIIIPEPEDLLYIVADSDGASVSPFHNFIEHISTGCSYTVEFEIKQIQGSAKAGVAVGSNASRRQADNSNGIGFRMAADGSFEVFDGTASVNTNLNSLNLNLFSDFGIVNDGDYFVSVEYFAPAFDGSGKAIVSIEIDSTGFFDFVTSSGLMGNYISLNSTYAGGTDGVRLDNLLIKSLPQDVLPTPVVFRARAFGNGLIPSETVTRTWLENRDFTLPVIAISLDPAYMWDDHIGIYIKGTNGIPGRGLTMPLNWNRDWRRPMHIEFFETNNQVAIEQDAGVEIFANTSRHSPLKSLAFYAKDFYGKAKFEHSIFPDRPAPYYRTFVLRNSSQSSGSYIRDAMKWDFVKDVIDVDIQAYRPVVLIVNGAYWGILNMRDKLNEYYPESYYGVDPNDVDLLRGAYFGARAGNPDHYIALIDYIRTHDMSLEESYEYMKAQMEVDQYINYEIFMIWMANIDWPLNNIKYWRPQAPDGRWRWMVYDTDISFWGSAVGNTAYPWHHTLKHAMNDVADLPDDEVFHTNAQAAELLNALMENESFKQQFVQHYAALLSSMFRPERIIEIINRLESVLEPEMPRHIERWQGLYNPPDIYTWHNNVQILRDFATLRHPYCYQYMLEKFGWTSNDLVALELAVPDPAMGSVRINRVPLSTNIYNGKVYKTFPFQIQARPAPGYRFLGWSGISGNNCDETVTLSSDAQISPIFAAIEPLLLRIDTDMYDFGLRWESYLNDIYTVEYADDLSSPFILLEQGVTSTPPENRYPVTDGASARFYRLIIEPPPEW